MEPFEVQVRRWVEKAGRQAEAAFRATAEDAASRVKELTPVRTGYLRANWTAIRPGDAEPVEGRTPPTDELIARLRLGDKIIILNPVKYARRVEFGFIGEDSKGRAFSQQGRGMVQQTVKEIPRLAQAATRRIIQGGGDR